MTAAEVAKLWAAVRTFWPRQALPLDDDQVVIVAGFFTKAGVTFDAALADVERRAGDEWPPTPGAIRDAVLAATRPAVPAPSEVLRLLSQAVSRYPRHEEAEALRWLADRSPHAARFAVEHGLNSFRREHLDDPDHGGAVRARLEMSVKSCSAGLERELTDGKVRTLVGDRIKALEAGTAGREGLRRLTAADVIPIRPELDAGEEAA